MAFQKFVIPCLLVLASCAYGTLVVQREWATPTFVFPSETDRQTALNNSWYVEGNSVAIDVDMHYDSTTNTSRMFITFPRFGNGRPMTLGTVDESGNITAYPDYSWHVNQGSNCDGLTSVFRVAIDQCNRLWVMDTGKIGDDQLCPPQLLAFDLANNDTLLYRHAINSTLYVDLSLFVTPVVDVRPSGNDCSNTFVYVADVNGYAILVFDVANDRAWRVAHRLHYPFPSRATFTIQGESFDIQDGILGMALSPYQRSKDRILYFHALAATTENIVQTRVLRNDTWIGTALTSLAPIDSMLVFPQERPSQAAAQAIDSDGIMYFGHMDPPSIWCWNTTTEFGPDNIHMLVSNNDTLQFASGVKVTTNLDGEQELWVMTCRFQKVMTGTMSTSEINFRIHSSTLSSLVDGTACKPSS